MPEDIECHEMSAVAADSRLRMEIVSLFRDTFNVDGPRDWGFGWNTERVDRFIFNKPVNNTEFVAYRIDGGLVACSMFTVDEADNVYLPGDVTYKELENHRDGIVRFLGDQAAGQKVAYFHFIATRPDRQGSARLMLGLMRLMAKRLRERMIAGERVAVIAGRTKRGCGFFRIFHALFHEHPVALYDCQFKDIVVMAYPAPDAVALFLQTDQEIISSIRRRR
jgi:hypothetical protein